MFAKYAAQDFKTLESLSQRMNENKETLGSWLVDCFEIDMQNWK